MRRNGWMVVWLAGVLALGCDGGTPAADGGRSDGGRTDSGTPVDSGRPVDSGTPTDSGTPVDGGTPTDGGGGGGDAHCEATHLILEAVDPGNTITIFNPTSSAVNVDTAGYVLCQRPQYPTLASLQGGVTIPAGGRHAFPWPLTFADTDAGGEIALYTSTAFVDPTALVDFVCWGTGHIPSRRDVAMSGGDWSGSCAPVITGPALRRIAGTTGTGAASYDPSGTTAPLSCP